MNSEFKMINCKKYKKNKYKTEGVLTIELSLLMPGIMAVIIFIIFASFYLHDKCVIVRACYTSAKKNCYINDEYLMSENIVQNVNDVLGADLFAKWDYIVESELNDNTLTVIIKGKIILTDLTLFNYFDARMFSVEEKISVYRIFETDYLCGM